MNVFPKNSNSTVSKDNFIRRMTAGVLLINLFVLVLAGLSLHQSRRQYEERAAVTTQNLAQVLEQYINGSILKIDVVLLAASDEIEKQIAGGGIDRRELNRFLNRHSAHLPELDGLRMANARGEIAYGKGVAGGDLKSIVDRNYFTSLRDDPKAGLFISKPLISRIIGKWAIIIARRVNRPNGSFAGVVYGVIPLEHFHNLFASIDVGKHGAITLRDREMGVIIRYPQPRRADGRMVVSSKLQELIKSGRNTGIYKALAPIDKIERTYTYRRLSVHPLYITVGLATEDYLAEWRREATIMSAVVALFFLFTLIASRRIWHDWKRKKIIVQTLMQQEAKFRTIADYTYDWEFWLSPDGTFIHTSPSCKRITGYDANVFYADPGLLDRIIYPDDQELFARHRREAETGLGIDSLTFRIRHANGIIRWLEHVCQPIVDESGTFLGVRGSNRDITERKQVEEALRKSEERYALAVQGANDGIWDTDLETGEVYFSPQWKSMLGYEDGEIPNKPEEWVERIHPDDLKMVMEARKAYLKGHRYSYRVEYRLRHKDCGYRWILSRGACLRDPQGTPYRFSGSHTDITERITLEHALRESEKKYRTLFEESKDVVFIIDATGRINDMNPAGTELLGYTKEELLSMSIAHDFGIPSTAMEDFMTTLAVSGFVKDFELELQRKDGGKVVANFSTTDMRNEAGEIIGYRGIAHDVTGHKRLELQLMRAQKMESIGLLAGGVAHDFNNLLTVISGYGETIRDSISADDELLHDSIEQILKAAERAAELARSLLAFSRKQVIHPRPVKVETIIRNSSKLIRRIISEDIVLSTSFSDGELPVMADAGQIEQVLMNLATNARDAMPHGGHLHISSEETNILTGSEAQYDVAKPGKYARISVSDTGSGIEEKYLDRIFEPFFTTKEVGKGTGLGLAMIHGIIKQHNGSIFVKSEPGKGTNFCIYLPIMENGHAAKEKRQAAAAAAFGGTETLLIAEDEDTVRTFMKKIFERAGYNVIAAFDGEDALEKFRENQRDISLILSDVIMPRKNGREILEEVRKIKSGTKVIFISGYTANVMHEKGIFAEDVDFITKPFVKDKLLQKVREVLDEG